MKRSFTPMLIIFLVLGGLFIVFVQTGIPKSLWKTQTSTPPTETFTKTTETTIEKDQKLDFLYLLYAESNHKNTYNVKIIDPATQKIEQISKVVLPPGASSFNYANGRLFYQVSLNYQPSGEMRVGKGEIFALDLRTGKKVQVLKALSVSKSRITESYLIVRDSLFFLSCFPISGDKVHSACRLKQLYLYDDQKREITRLYDFGDAFRKTSSKKTIEAYYPKRDALILSEWLNYGTYDPAVINYYEVSSEVSLDEPKLTRIKSLTQEEMSQIVRELKNTDKERCRRLALESKSFQSDRTVRGGSQVPIGCFNLEELRVLSQ